MAEKGRAPASVGGVDVQAARYRLIRKLLDKYDTKKETRYLVRQRCSADDPDPKKRARTAV